MNSLKRKIKRCNLLVVGASGGVANAFLHHLCDYRNLFKKLVLPEKEKEYLSLLKKYKVQIVLDLTDMDSTAILEATNKAKVSYVNTALNDRIKSADELVFNIIKKKDQINGAPHIICSGMNPGVVNMWVRYGIEKYGVPTQIIHFEYDTSKLAKKWHPLVTWSIHEFLTEAIKDPSGLALGKNKIKKLLPNALENRKDMKSILSPIMKLDKYPSGLTVLHEENISLSYLYNIPSKFIYAINQQTMDNLIKLYKKNKNVRKKDLVLGDNTSEVLSGEDNIGVILEYSDKLVYYFNTFPNVAVIGTNATYTQVIIGVFSALFTLLIDNLPPKVYFVEDLFDTHYKYFLFDNLRVQEFVFNNSGSRPVLQYYNPMVKIRRRDRFEHMYLI